MVCGQRRISRGWSTEERRSSWRSGTIELIAFRFFLVSRGFRRRRRSLERGGVGQLGDTSPCTSGGVAGRLIAARYIDDFVCLQLDMIMCGLLTARCQTVDRPWWRMEGEEGCEAWSIFRRAMLMVGGACVEGCGACAH